MGNKCLYVDFFATILRESSSTLYKGKDMLSGQLFTLHSSVFFILVSSVFQQGLTIQEHNGIMLVYQSLALTTYARSPNEMTTTCSSIKKTKKKTWFMTHQQAFLQYTMKWRSYCIIQAYFQTLLK